MADAAGFSFIPEKPRSAGDGGAVVTNDGKLAEKIRGSWKLWFRQKISPCLSRDEFAAGRSAGGAAANQAAVSGSVERAAKESAGKYLGESEADALRCPRQPRGK